MLAARRVAVERRLSLEAEQELQLAELERLESASRLEALAEREELERGHGLEHVDLGDRHLEDREDALEGRERARRVPLSQQGLQVVELVQHLLEPQLVDLVNDDEQRLIVLRPVRERLLEREKLVELEVAGVRDGHRRGSPLTAGGGPPFIPLK